jgi:SAM-dependent methyltransferase
MKARNPFRSLRILGVSDGYLTSTVLTKIYRKQYVNYHYHLDPKLDITEVSSHLISTADIISCSEVLEHVEPPIQKAFLGLYQLLRTNGKLVLSVPHTDINGTHVEHFPVMTESRILSRENGLVLEGKGPKGELFAFGDLTFHGGIGATLEYRIFSKNSLEQNLEAAGFKRLKSCNNNIFFGVYWEPWSRVWTATK